MPVERHLIVTADDLGYNVERNAGIAECFRRDAISRSSLLVNGVAAADAAAMAKDLKLPLGLHLNLTEGSTLSPPESVPSLVKPDGFMLGMFGFKDAVKAQKVSLAEVKTEIQSQIQAFRNLTGTDPLYVDGHQHAHVLPEIVDVFAECGIVETRLPWELEIQGDDWVEPWLMGFFQETIQQAIAAKPVLDKAGVRYADRYIGLTTMGAGMTIERLQMNISRALSLVESPAPDAAPANQVTCCELMVHPGYACVGEGGCGDGADDFSKSRDRDHETEIVTSKEMLKFYADNHIVLKASCRD